MVDVCFAVGLNPLVAMLEQKRHYAVDIVFVGLSWLVAVAMLTACGVTGARAAVSRHAEAQLQVCRASDNRLTLLGRALKVVVHAAPRRHQR